MFEDDGFRKARVATLIAFLLNGFTVGSFISRIPDYKNILNISNSLLGTSLFFASVGVLTALRPTSKLAARYGSGPITRYGAFTLILGVPLVGLLFTLQWFWVSLFIFGFVSSVHDLSMNSQASALEHHAKKRVMSKFHAMWSLGGLSGGAIGGVFANFEISPRDHSFVVGLIILIVAFTTKDWFMPGSADRHEVVSEEKPNKRPRKLIILGLFGLGGAICEGAASDWGGVLARETFNASPFVATLPYILFSVMMVTVRLSGDWLANRFGIARLLTWSGTIAGGGLILGLSIGNVYGVIIGWILLGAGVATVIPLVVSVCGELANSEFSGKISAAESVALVTGVAYFGFVIGPPLLGFIADLVTLRVAMYIPAGLALIIALTAKRVVGTK
jgi:MFS family permease